MGDNANHVYRSTDYGATWIDLGIIASAGIYAMAYLGNGIAILGDNDRHVYRSTDYGATWADLGMVVFNAVRSMAYLGNGIAILGDSVGRVYRSTDYGATWADLGVIASGTVWCMSYLGNGIVILGDFALHVYRSTDYGATWADLGVIASSWIYSMAYLGNGIVILGDDQRRIYRSTSAFQLSNFNPHQGPPVVPTTLVVAASNSLDPSRADYQCDGVDDQIEIQAAIDALPAIGGEVNLLEGTYSINDPILMPSNSSLVGSGFSTVLRLVDAKDVNIRVIINADGVAGNQFIVIKNLTIDGNRAAQAAGLQYGIFFDNVSYSLIENLHVKDFRQATPTAGIAIYNSTRNIISGNTVEGCWTGIKTYQASNYNIITKNLTRLNAYHGIGVDYNSYYLNINGNVCVENAVGIQIVRGFDLLISNNLCHSNTSEGISTDSNSSRLVIHGNTIRTNGSNGIAVSASQSMVSDNHCTGNTHRGIQAWAVDLVIVGNVASNNNEAGIQLEPDAHRAIIKGNITNENRRDGIYVRSDNCVISGNFAQSNSQINNNVSSDITTDGDYNNIQNNTCRAGPLAFKPRHGIRVSAAGATLNLVANNDLYNDGFATSPFGDVGAGTIVRNNRGWVTENSGAATVVNGTTLIVVNHGLVSTPTRVFLTTTLWSNSNKAWVTNLTATQFTINVDADPGVGTATFNWKAQVGEG